MHLSCIISYLYPYIKGNLLYYTMSVSTHLGYIIPCLSIYLWVYYIRSVDGSHISGGYYTMSVSIYVGCIIMSVSIYLFRVCYTMDPYIWCIISCLYPYIFLNAQNIYCKFSKKLNYVEVSDRVGLIELYGDCILTLFFISSFTRRPNMKTTFLMGAIIFQRLIAQLNKYSFLQPTYSVQLNYSIHFFHRPIVFN